MPRGFKVAFTQLGIAVALVSIGLPFRSCTALQPVLAELFLEIEEASASLGATRFMFILNVVLPPLVPALLTGFALAFAIFIVEYGSRDLHRRQHPLCLGDRAATHGPEAGV